MKKIIQTVFANDGRLELMRSEESQVAARRKLMETDVPEVVEIPDGQEIEDTESDDSSEDGGADDFISPSAEEAHVGPLVVRMITTLN